MSLSSGSLKPIFKPIEQVPIPQQPLPVFGNPLFNAAALSNQLFQSQPMANGPVPYVAQPSGMPAQTAPSGAAAKLIGGK